MGQKAAEEITYLPDPEIQACHARYVAIMEEMPPPNLDVTTEQLACLDFIVNKTAKPPYADFSIFGRNGTRLLRRLTMTGLALQAGGTWKHLEIYGPPRWKRGWSPTTCSPQP